MQVGTGGSEERDSCLSIGSLPVSGFSFTPLTPRPRLSLSPRSAKEGEGGGFQVRQSLDKYLLSANYQSGCAGVQTTSLSLWGVILLEGEEH